MKVLVCVKQVVAAPKYLEFASDGLDIDPAFVVRELNDADTNAIEAALQIKDSRPGVEVIAITAGGPASDEALRQAMARGVDRYLRVAASGAVLHDPIAVARRLAFAARKEAPDLILCGVQSSDAAQQSTGPALASALGIPCVAVATKLELDTEGKSLVVQREFEGGAREIVEVDLPAVITVQVGLNAPRYVSFKGMARAKKTPIAVIETEGIAACKVTLRRMTAPSADARKTPRMIAGGPAEIADALLKLVNEARS
jgi:electron transfer flavoprotein beta subunit